MRVEGNREWKWYEHGDDGEDGGVERIGVRGGGERDMLMSERGTCGRRDRLLWSERPSGVRGAFCFTGHRV